MPTKQPKKVKPVKTPLQRANAKVRKLKADLTYLSDKAAYYQQALAQADAVIDKIRGADPDIVEWAADARPDNRLPCMIISSMWRS